MVVVRIGRPSVSTTTDKAMKPAAYGQEPKPSTAPTYPITVANVNGKGRYRIVIAGDGDNTAVFTVNVDGPDSVIESARSDVPAVIEGMFYSSVVIKIEGSGLHSTFTYEVWVEQDYVTSVAIS